MVKEEKSLTITFDGSELFGAPTGPFPMISDLFIQVRSIEHIHLMYSSTVVLQSRCMSE